MNNPQASTALARGRDQDVWKRHLAFLVGFTLEFNLLPRAAGIPIERLSIIVQLLVIAICLPRMLGTKYSARLLLMIVFITTIFFLNIIFNDTSLIFGDNNLDLAVSLNYAISALSAAGVLWLIGTDRGAAALCWGIVIGGALASVVPVFQAIGAQATLVQFGLVPRGQTIQIVGGQIGTRVGGLWGHANELGHVIAITVPAAIAISNARYGRLAVGLAIAANLLTFYMVGNRGGVIAAAITIVVAAYLGRSIRVSGRRAFVASSLALIVAPIAIALISTDNLAYQRFASDANFGTNLSGRLASTIYSLKMALLHPFGIGWSDWHSELRSATGFSATHNGFISIAFAFGTVFCALLIVSIFIILFSAPGEARGRADVFLFYAAVQVSASLFFEQLGYSAPYITLSCLMVASMILKFRSRVVIKSHVI